MASHRQGDPQRAGVLLAESLSLYREVGDRRNAALAALDLADALRDSDDLTQAGVHYRDALGEFGAVEDRALVAQGLLGLGSVMVREGEFKNAAKLLGAASALTLGEEPDSGEGSPETVHSEEDLNAIRSALGEEAFTATWEAGRALSLEAAVQAALSSAIP